MRVTAVTPMKNEGPYIIEWVAHHRAMGINDIHVFTNDCDDGTDLICERLDEMDLIRHMPNPSVVVKGARHHILLLNYANYMARLKRSDWVTFLDADEFVRVKPGKGHLEDLFNALPEAHAITLSLHSFGSDGRDEIAESLVSEGFSRRRGYEDGPMPTKYLARMDFPWKVLANNCPHVHLEDIDRVNWVNGSGEPIARQFRENHFKALDHPHNGVDLVDVAHYTVRSFQSYMVQKDRGSANPKGEVQKLKIRASRLYWEKFDQNEVVDDLLVTRAPALRDEVAELMGDAELAQLHEASVAWHRAKAQELLQQENYAKLYRMIRRDHRHRFGAREAAE